MNFQIPDELVPDEADMPFMDFIVECEGLWIGLLEEYLRGEFAGRTHGTHWTYQSGCTGPYCLSAHRIRTRASRGGQPNDYWRVYEPVLEYMIKYITERYDATMEAAVNKLSLGLSMEFLDDRDDKMKQRNIVPDLSPTPGWTGEYVRSPIEELGRPH